MSTPVFRRSWRAMCVQRASVANATISGVRTASRPRRRTVRPPRYPRPSAPRRRPPGRATLRPWPPAPLRSPPRAPSRPSRRRGSRRTSAPRSRSPRRPSETPARRRAAPSRRRELQGRQAPRPRRRPPRRRDRRTSRDPSWPCPWLVALHGREQRAGRAEVERAALVADLVERVLAHEDEVALLDGHEAVEHRIARRRGADAEIGKIDLRAEIAGSDGHDARLDRVDVLLVVTPRALVALVREVEGATGALLLGLALLEQHEVVQGADAGHGRGGLLLGLTDGHEGGLHDVHHLHLLIAVVALDEVTALGARADGARGRQHVDHLAKVVPLAAVRARDRVDAAGDRLLRRRHQIGLHAFTRSAARMSSGVLPSRIDCSMRVATSSVALNTTWS